MATRTLAEMADVTPQFEPAAKARREPYDWFLPLLSLPAMLAVFLVIGVPLLYSLALSLNRINMLTQKWVFVGLRNYLTILPQADFLWALARTAYFAAVTVLAGLVLGVAIALVLNAKFPGRGILRSVVLIPWAMSPVAVGVLWVWIFDGSYGALNGALMDLGLIATPIRWLAGVLAR